MMRKLLFLVFAFSLAIGVQAQVEKAENVFVPSAAPQQANVFRTPAVTPADGQVWWANYDLDASPFYINGTKIAEHYDVAVLVPSGLAVKGDATVAGFSFYSIIKNLSNVKVWVSNTLPTGNEVLESVDVASSDVAIEKFNDVKFSKEYTIPAEGIYVGFSFDVTSLSEDYAKTPLIYSDTENNRVGGMMYRTKSTVNWKSIDGNAVVKILLGGGNIASNAASASDFGTAYVLKGNGVSVPVRVRNMGTNPIKTISYTITTDGVTSPETTIATDIKGFQSSATVQFPFYADEETKKYDKLLTITKVNEQPNELTANTAKGTLITMNTKITPVPVVEEFTGLWCGYCPRGIVGMQTAEQTYGDKVVLLAVHAGDVMEIQDYSPILRSISSYPEALFNRQYIFDPSASAMARLINEGLERQVPGEVQVTAQWTSVNDFKVTSTTTFGYDDSNAKYGVAYVLVADGLKGTGSSWMQANYYSGQSGNELMKFWYDAPANVSGLEYNHVPVAAWKIFEGFDGSVPTIVEAGEQYSHSFYGSVSGNTLVQDKQKLSVVALMIDRTNNQIINAAKTTILPAEEQAVRSIEADDATEVARYDATGRRLTTSQKGLNIIRLANGKSVKKIEN